MINVQMVYCNCIEINSTHKMLCFCIEHYLSISNAFSKSRVIILNSWNGSLYMLRRFQNGINHFDVGFQGRQEQYLISVSVMCIFMNPQNLQCSAVIRHSADYKIPIYFGICLYLWKIVNTFPMKSRDRSRQLENQSSGLNVYWCRYGDLCKW